MVYSPATQSNSRVATMIQSKWLGFGLLFAVVALVATYLVQINGVAAQGMELRNLRATQSEYRLARQALESKISELQSYTVSEGEVSASSFIAVERVEYLAAVPSTVGVAVK